MMRKKSEISLLAIFYYSLYHARIKANICLIRKERLICLVQTNCLPHLIKLALKKVAFATFFNFECHFTVDKSKHLP